MALDYRKFYHLERYLFDEVGPGFAETGNLSPVDFYMIVIWKANRAKTRILTRLNKHEGGFTAAIKDMAAALSASGTPMRRLEVLMKDWGFLLPMATAILTVLYPTEFSVYDIRVCQQLEKFEELATRRFSSRLWAGYQAFLQEVENKVPGELSLRDKDRYLWGKSFFEGVENDLRG